MNREQIMQVIDNLQSGIDDLRKIVKPEAEEEIMTLSELMQYDPKKRSKQFFYNNIKQIPHFHKGIKLRFIKKEIDTWLSKN